LNGNGVVELIGTTSSTSFTQLATFGRRHHSLPIIYYVLLHGDHIQLSLFHEIPKWESQN